jgi:hypothetical protein
LDIISKTIEELRVVLMEASETERSLQMKRELLEIYSSKQSEAQELSLKYFTELDSLYN